MIEFELKPRSESSTQEEQDVQGREAMVQITRWLQKREPFCLMRYGDGEFWTATGHPGGGKCNADGNSYDIPGLREAVKSALLGVAARYPNWGNVLVGGSWGAHPSFLELLKQHDLFRRIPWTGANPPISCIGTGETMPFLKALADDPRRKVLVCKESVRPCCGFMNAMWVRTPDVDTWLEKERIQSEVGEAIGADGIALYAAGQAARPLAWQGFDSIPGTTHMDIGHIFDAACGNEVHSWLWPVEKARGNSRWVIFRDEYIPFILGEGK